MAEKKNIVIMIGRIRDSKIFLRFQNLSNSTKTLFFKEANKQGVKIIAIRKITYYGEKIILVN